MSGIRPWKIGQLIRVPMLSWANFNDMRHGRTRQARITARLQFGVVIWALLETAGLVVIMLNGSFKAGVFGSRPELALTFIFAGASMAILLMSAFTATNGIFRFRDYEQVAVLPATKIELVLSRVALTLSYDVLIAVAIVLPGAGVYHYYAGAGWWFWPTLIVATPLLLMVPYGSGLLLGLGATLVARGRRHSQSLTAIAIIAVLIPVVAYSNTASRDLFSAAGALGDAAGYWYPPVRWLTLALVNGDIGALAGFVGVSLAVFGAAIVAASTQFSATNATASNVAQKKPRGAIGARPQQVVRRSVIVTLLSREFARLTGSALYLTNSSFGLVIMLAGSFALPFVAPAQLETMLELPGFADALSSYAPLVMGAVVSTLGITASSVSLEGRSLWLIKSTPVPPRTVLWSKVLLATLVPAPFIFLSCVPIWLTLRPSAPLAALMVTHPLTVALVLAQLGLLLNLAFPKIEWISEVEPIKQSMPVLATLAVGIGTAALPFWAAGHVNLAPAQFVLAVNVCYALVAVIGWYALSTWGVRRWNNIF